MKTTIERGLILAGIVFLLSIQAIDIIYHGVPWKQEINSLINTFNIMGLLRLHYLIGKHDTNRTNSDIKISDLDKKFEILNKKIDHTEKQLQNIKKLVNELVRTNRNKSKTKND